MTLDQGHIGLYNSMVHLDLRSVYQRPEWIRAKWEERKLGMNYSLSTVDGSGLMNVSSNADWLRFGMGGHNIEVRWLLHRAKLAAYFPRPTRSSITLSIMA